MTLRTVLLSLQALLAAAEPDDPQDAVVANQVRICFLRYCNSCFSCGGEVCVVCRWFLWYWAVLTKPPLCISSTSRTQKCSNRPLDCGLTSMQVLPSQVLTTHARSTNCVQWASIRSEPSRKQVWWNSNVWICQWGFAVGNICQIYNKICWILIT